MSAKHLGMSYLQLVEELLINAKNKFFYIILFSILGIYAYKFFVFNHYIIKEIVIENQSNRSEYRYDKK